MDPMHRWKPADVFRSQCAVWSNHMVFRLVDRTVSRQHMSGAFCVAELTIKQCRFRRSTTSSQTHATKLPDLSCQVIDDVRMPKFPSCIGSHLRNRISQQHDTSYAICAQAPPSLLFTSNRVLDSDLLRRIAHSQWRMRQRLCSTGTPTDRVFSTQSPAWVFFSVLVSLWTTSRSTNPLPHETACVCTSSGRRTFRDDRLEEAPVIVGRGTGRDYGERHPGASCLPVKRMRQSMKQAFTGSRAAFRGGKCPAAAWEYLITARYRHCDVHTEGYTRISQNG